MVAEAAFGTVSGVVLCRPGGSYPGSLLVSNCIIQSASAFNNLHAPKTLGRIMRKWFIGPQMYLPTVGIVRRRSVPHLLTTQNLFFPLIA